MAKTITVYSTASCPFCIRLKMYLDEHKFPYTEKRVDLDQNAALEMYNKSQQRGVPFTIITDDDGTEHGVLGFDVPLLQKELLG
ncbi:MAG: glutaredoxin family protein [Patescibacteria group bacterium]|jgi:glutaredoxin|nr:glutaredoxin family protein [Patescibacteria group bacterium]